MSVIVKVTCDRDIGDGTCAETAWGRVGEDVPQTLERAGRAGWHVVHAAGRNARTVCPWHTALNAGGTGPL